VALVVLEAATDRTVMDGEHIGEFVRRALDAENRPTPRALGVAVGDEVENVMARALAVSPQQRPQDAGELWGMLKHAMRVDAESGRAPHSHRVERDSPAPATLRIDEPMPEGSASPVVEVARVASTPPPTFSRPHGGTLRMAPSALRPLSGSEALAAMPFPSNAPPPADVPLDSAPVTLRIPPRAAATPTPEPVSSAVAAPVVAGSALRTPKRSRAPVLVAILLSMLVVALAATLIARRAIIGRPPPATAPS